MLEQARNAVHLDRYPVHLACRDGDVQSLAKYVGLRQDTSRLVEEDDFYHWTPLHFASFFGQLPALIVLREAGVSVDVTTAKFQQTAAHIAAFAGADHCLKYLVHFGCNVNKQDYLGETPLHKAARCGSVACGRVLALDGRALPHVLNSSGQTPAALAAACGHAEMAACLTEYETTSAAAPLPADEDAPVPRSAPAGQTAPPAADSGGRLALNGGLVPERDTAPSGPWCYQPPSRHPATAAAPAAVPAAAPAQGPEAAQMDTDCGAEDGTGAATQPGHFTLRQSGGLPYSGRQDGVMFSASVGDHFGNGWHGNGWHGNGGLGDGCTNGFRKRSSDEDPSEGDFKKRRLFAYGSGDGLQASPLQPGVAVSAPGWPTDPYGRR